MRSWMDFHGGFDLKDVIMWGGGSDEGSVSSSLKEEHNQQSEENAFNVQVIQYDAQRDLCIRD